MQPLYDDPVMASLIEKHGEVTVEPAEDMFRRFTVSVINQQLSSASAAAIRERVFDRFEIAPDSMLAADVDELRELGLSSSKIEYIKNVAAAFTEYGYSIEYFDAMSDEEVIAELTAIKGVGVWTAKMALMFCLGREDIFPVEDLGIRRGMQVAYGIDDRNEMEERAHEWSPYRSYASRYLWRVAD